MNDKETKEQLHGILLALDKALERGPWSASTFLTLIGKKLKLIRDNLVDNLQEAENESLGGVKISQSTEKFSSMKRIYIALYAFDGSNLQSWERIIDHLPDQVISRPVYANEEDVIANIRSKSNRINEAYAAIYVDPLYILQLPKERVLVDKLGNPLLSLKDKAINLNNFDELVHQSGNYRYVGGRLIKK